jgi:hypothetical protein
MLLIAGMVGFMPGLDLLMYFIRLSERRRVAVITAEHLLLPFSDLQF